MSDLISREELEAKLAAYEKETGDDLGVVYNIIQKLAFANKGTAGDLISRKAAIDGLDGHYVECETLNDWQEI